MAAKRIGFDHEARQAIRRGVNKLARAVKATLGPRGRNVIIEKKFGAPTITKDGVTVAKEIELEESWENIGVQMVKEVASKTSDVAGDGTTTATVLAEALYEEGLKNVTAGADSMALKRGIEKAVAAVIDWLKKKSTDVGDRKDKIAQVATIAANGDPEIGKKIADAMEKVGSDGVVTVEEGKSMETTVDLVEGMQFDRGFISPYFVTNPEEMECVLEDAFILIHEKKIGTVKDFLPLLERVAKSGKPLLVIAEDVDAEALATLVVNKLRGTVRACAVKAPGYGDRRKAMLQDVAVLTGGKAIFDDLGLKLEGLKLEDLGRAKKVVIDKENTTIVEGAGKHQEIQGRIAQIKKELDATTSDYDKEKLQERLAKLAGGVAEINVGGATEVEVKEKKARVEDALHATRAAIKEGILPGGGVALLRATEAVEALMATLSGDEKVGADIVRRALHSPIRAIVENGGVDGSVVVEHVRAEKSFNYGYNAETAQYQDLFEAGVIDPTMVTRCALQNAASIATLLLTTDAIVSEIKEDKEAEVGAGAEEY